MTVFTQRWILSGMSSAAVIVLGIMLLFVLLPQKEVMHPATTQSAPKPAMVLPRVISGQPAVEKLDNRRQLEEVVVTSAPAAPRAKDEGAAGFGIERSAGKAARIFSTTMLQPEDGTARYYRDRGRDRFESVTPNPVRLVAEEPVSTFSVDVDTVSYSFVRRQLNQGLLPQKSAVRLEEMVNYFSYDYTGPTDKNEPFRANIAVIDSPWRAGNKLVHIGIKGYQLLPAEQRQIGIVGRALALDQDAPAYMHLDVRLVVMGVARKDDIGLDGVIEIFTNGRLKTRTDVAAERLPHVDLLAGYGKLHVP